MQSCASSRPGLSTSNTLSRHFSQEVVNYGFSGAANLEKEVAEVIASRDEVEMFIVDCEANAGMSMNMYNNIEEFFRIFLLSLSYIYIISHNFVKVKSFFKFF